MFYVDDEHVRDWMDAHHAAVLPASASTRFDEALLRLPWVGTAPDWSAIGTTKVALGGPDAWSQIAASPLGGYEYAFLMYSAEEPGVAATVRDLLDDIDVLTWRAPGWRFVCGVVRLGDGWDIKPDDFGAYEGMDHLMLRTGDPSAAG